MKKLIGYLFKFLAWCISNLPIRIQFFLGDLLGWLWFDIFRLRRQLVLSNLRIAFPNKSQSDLIKLGRNSICNLGRGFIEFCHFPFMSTNLTYYQSQFIIEGREHLNAALEKKRGVCLLTLHLGNGDYATAGLSIYGIKIHLISKTFKMKWLNDLWFTMRKKMGTEFIPPRNSAYAILKALKANQIVVFVQDQFMGPPIGVKTHFFGRETGTALGLSIMASRYNSPIVPVYNFRRYDGKIVIIFEQEMTFSEMSDEAELQKHITQKCNDKLQEFIEKHPDQWMWVHHRWKQGKFKD
jgi:KDO2-lipid IV(A) lauroyltransferase